MSEQVTVTATEVVATIFIELVAPPGFAPNVQGSKQVRISDPVLPASFTLKATGTGMAVASAAVRKNIADTSPEMQAAIETIAAEVLTWTVDPPIPPPTPE